MTHVQKYRVFVASPPDVAKERQSLCDAIEEINQTFGSRKKIRLVFVSGEADVTPNTEPPQDAINRQIDISPIDIFVGIIWGCFGAPTTDGGGGTKQEFTTVLESWKATQRPRIMLYFNRMPPPITTRNELKQYDQVLEFREQCDDQAMTGLYRFYDGPDNFKGIIRGHLMTVAGDLFNPPTEATTGVNPVDVESWKMMSHEERARVARDAAGRHDPDALFSLMTAWLRTRTSGRVGADVTTSTLRNYRTGLHQLLAAWEHEDLLHPTPTAAKTWVRDMQRRGRKALTIQVRIGGARALYGALRWSGAVADLDPFADITIRDDRPSEGESTPYSSAEFDALRAAADAEDLVLLLLTGVAGLGAGECVNLRWEDINLTRGLLLVRQGKGHKTRSVPLDISLAQALRAIPKKGREYVLPFRKPITVWRRFKLLCERAGVTFKTGNALRHTAGIRWYRQTKSLEMTAQYLGLTPVSALRYIKWSEQYP